MNDATISLLVAIPLVLLIGVVLGMCIIADLQGDDYKIFREDVLEVTYGDLTIVAPHCVVKIPDGKFVIIGDDGNSYLIEDASIDVKELRAVSP